MNCPNCAAPLRPIAGRKYLFCEHCSTFHYPEASPETAGSPDRVIRLGERSDLRCPVCDVDLVTATSEGLSLLSCPQCDGLLATNDDFSLLVRLRRAAHEGPPAQPVPLEPVELARTTTCPNCRKAMETHPYYGPGNVVIDTCPRCKVLWLDSGELAAIERAPGSRW